MKIHTHLAAAVLLATLVPTLAAGAAVAKSGDEVSNRGSCTVSSHWKIKAKPDDSRIEVEAQIDSNHVGQTWTWVLRHNGSVSARGKSVTKAPSGSFTVNRRTVNAAGTDAFRFRATRASGEVCVARVSL